MTASVVVQACKQQFAYQCGFMGGSQFTAWEFARFSKNWGFQHTLSFPYNSQSYGKTESALKIAKRLMKRSTDPYLALLEWRNTPTIGIGSSPAQRLLSRRTRGRFQSCTLTCKHRRSRSNTKCYSRVDVQKEEYYHLWRQGSLRSITSAEYACFQDAVEAGDMCWSIV